VIACVRRSTHLLALHPHQEKPMICPRCETVTLTEMDRDGVTIDRCARCRGIWLDRGELEKLMARGRDGGPPVREVEARDHERLRHDDDDDDDRRGRGRGRSWWDIFD
jgi:uncharacterized protein